MSSNVIDVQKYIKNGFYIPFFHVGIYYITNNFFLSTIIALKMYPANYFYWFCSYYEYKNLPKWVGSLKQFIRFTDTGHLASFIYFFNPSFFPIGYNIHAVISMGYWCGKLFFNIKDQDDRDTSEIIKSFENVWSYSNHICPFLLFIRELWIQPELCSMNMFIFEDLYYSYKWIYCWLMFVYLPWRAITGDYIYSILSHETSIKDISYFLIFMHGTFLISNMSGATLHYIHCK